MARKRKKAVHDRPGPIGFLVVDKPEGYTSHDVVDVAREWLGIRRIGHLGTLDPQATGVLPLAIRAATKLVPFFQKDQKSYVGTVRLGVETDTLDGEGQVTRRHDGLLPAEESVREALAGFVGESLQIPPMFSAVKLGGVPLHKLARQGEEVERAPKKVRIDRLELLRFEPPDAEIAVECGTGTYVRSLAYDLGRQLGCGAYLASLRRLRSGPFEISQAHTLLELEQAADQGRIEQLFVRPEVALGFPTVTLADVAVQRIRSGGEISPGTIERARSGTLVSALDIEGRLIAVLELRADRRLWPSRVLPGSEE